MARPRWSRVATIGGCGAALALLAGRFVAEPTLLDSWAIRVETRTQSTAALFAAGGGDANPFWRPTFHWLHAGADRLGATLLGDGDRGLRLLALLAFWFAALALFRHARALRLPRGVAAAAALLFCLAPPAVTTAGWPVAASWPLGVGCTLLATAAALRHVRGDGGSGAAVQAVLFTALGLTTSQAPWHLAPFLALLCLVPPSVAPGARRRALLLAPPIGALLLLHAGWLETAARPAAGSEFMPLLARAVQALPRYLEGGLGGDAIGGARPLAWAALLLIAATAWRDRRRRFLAAQFALAPLPFAIAGHADRYALLTTALGVLAFAAAAPVALAAMKQGATRRARWLPAAALAVVFLVQVRPRLFLLAAANDEAGRITAAVRAAGTALLDAPAAQLINAPPYLDQVVRGLRLEEERVARVAGSAPRAAPGFALPHAALVTRDGFFALEPPDAASAGGVRPFEWDGAALVERPPAAPLGERRELPAVFLAGGFDLLAAPAAPHATLAPFLLETAAVARTRELADPLATALIERPLAGLVAPLPTDRLDWRIEPLAAAPGERRRPSAFDLQLVATVDVPRPALLVVGVTWLGPVDPLRFILGTMRRGCDHFRAELDGAPIRIEPVFGHACGIVVPAGRHEVIVRGR